MRTRLAVVSCSSLHGRVRVVRFPVKTHYLHVSGQQKGREGADNGRRCSPPLGIQSAPPATADHRRRPPNALSLFLHLK